MEIRKLELYANFNAEIPVEEILNSKYSDTRKAYATIRGTLKFLAEKYSNLVEELEFRDVPGIVDVVDDSNELVNTLIRTYPDLFKVLAEKKDPEQKLIKTKCPELKNAVREAKLVHLRLRENKEKHVYTGIEARLMYDFEEKNGEAKKEMADCFTKLYHELKKYNVNLDRDLLAKQGYVVQNGNGVTSNGN